jgi:4-diphosphocytidyl-2-C-methyl-D-erythritol kinase
MYRMSEWTHWPAPAKLNLFLRITGRRDDGYHELQTVFQLLDWGDRVSLKCREDGVISRAQADYPVPAEQDIAVRAAHALQQHSACAMGAEIRVDKQIPMGGGFGGGSSNAASVLVALNTLWNCGLGLPELAQLGRQLGADVPVFVYGQNAWAEGIGDRLTPIQLPKAWFLVIDTGVHVATAELFQSPQLTRTQKLVKIESYVSGSLQGNAFESLVRQAKPPIDRVFKYMASFGQVALTGTGGGCFMRFSSQESAAEAQAHLPDGLRSWVVASAPESTLHAALRLYQRKSIT